MLSLMGTALRQRCSPLGFTRPALQPQSEPPHLHASGACLSHGPNSVSADHRLFIRGFMAHQIVAHVRDEISAAPTVDELSAQELLQGSFLQLFIDSKVIEPNTPLGHQKPDLVLVLCTAGDRIGIYGNLAWLPRAIHPEPQQEKTPPNSKHQPDNPEPLIGS